MARQWRAVKGSAVNANIVKNICKKYPNLTVQIGGGIRNIATIEEYLAAGVNYVILGTKAVNNPEFLQQASALFPHKIILGLDAKDGYISIDGWHTTSKHRAIDFAQQHDTLPLAAIIYTDIDRDGAMMGPNVIATAEMANAVSIPIIASGGVSSLSDLKALKECGAQLNGAISGRALYDQKFTVQQALEVLDA